MTVRGQCHCGGVRFEMRREPIFVHACHCRDCQVQTGGVFVVNALLEASELAVTGGRPEPVAMRTDSGGRHVVHRCPECRTALWSEYTTPGVYFVRALTLEGGQDIRPDVHIFTRSQHPLVRLPEDAVRFEAFYDPREVWPEAAKARFRAARAAAGG